MKTGTVTKFDEMKGFGFIQSESKETVFVTWKVLRDIMPPILTEGQSVLFKAQNSEKGWIATEVRLP